MVESNKTKISYKEIKEAFISNPEDAKIAFGRNLSISEKQEGSTWFIGNCTLKKECILAMCRHMNLPVAEFIGEQKKHNLVFTVGTAYCAFGKKAQITCNDENAEIMKAFALLMYPVESVNII